MVGVDSVSDLVVNSGGEVYFDWEDVYEMNRLVGKRLSKSDYVSVVKRSDDSEYLVKCVVSELNVIVVKVTRMLDSAVVFEETRRELMDRDTFHYLTEDREWYSLVLRVV